VPVTNPTQKEMRHMMKKETKQQQEYMQQMTLYFEGIEKAGILIGEEDVTTHPCLLLTSNTHPVLIAVLKSDAAVVEDVEHFIEWTSAGWEKGDRKGPVNVLKVEDVKRMLAGQKKDEIPTFNNHLNVPITLKRETTDDSDCFLSVAFPSKEFLAMGSGQPKIIITQIAESKARIGEILDEMAIWVAIRLGGLAAAA
jgi:hypothetical protein